MKESILLSELQNYLAYGLKVRRTTEETDEVLELTPFKAGLFFDGYYIDFKPLVRPLSELLEFMPDILKNLSKLCLDDCTFDEKCYEEEINQWWVNAFDGDRVIACLTFDENAFYIQYWHGTADDTFDIYEPQFEAFQELFKNHFDVFNWIGRGLAISLTDFEKEKAL